METNTIKQMQTTLAQKTDMCLQLGMSQNFASVKMVESMTGRKFDWKPLKMYCQKHELEVGKVVENNYVKFNAYNKEAWFAVYEVRLYDMVSVE
jgi:hypothetical protein